MQVEARLFRALPIRVSAEPRHGDESNGPPETTPNAFGDPVSVHARQTDVAECDVGLDPHDEFDARLAVICRVDLVAPRLEETLHHLAHVGVVFDERDDERVLSLRW